MIILYLFTAVGVFVWDEYPTYAECMEVKVELVEWFSGDNDQDLYSIDCIKLGSIKWAKEKSVESAGQLFKTIFRHPSLVGVKNVEKNQKK